MNSKFIFEVIDEEYKEFTINIQKYFKSSLTSIHKARNEIKIIVYKDKEYVVKSFKKPNIINKLLYIFFKDSKAKRSYKNSLQINKFTAKPIGYIEYLNNGFLQESYFISEKFKYDFTIREPLLDNRFEDRKNIFKEFAKFTYQLHQKDIFHLDYSPGNILIKKDSEKYTFKIVDINRMNFKKLNLDEKLSNFKMLWAKDDDMKIIAAEYAKLLNKDEEYCIKKAIYYSQKQKDFKNFKKRIKGKKVVD